jgi:hypothetical protein
MKLKTAVRPAQRILAGTLVAAVTATCLVTGAAPASAAGTSSSDSVVAKKEYKKESVAPAKKEYKKESVAPAKKEYKKESVAPARKEH